MITEQDHDDVQCGFTETELEWHSSASLDEERAPSLATTTSGNDCACAQGHHIKDATYHSSVFGLPTHPCAGVNVVYAPCFARVL